MKYHQKPATPDTEKAAVSAGMRLREAREARDLSLRDITKSTYQSPGMLMALETMQTTELPKTVVRMHARVYARFLGLPENDIIEGLNVQHFDSGKKTRLQNRRIRWRHHLASRRLILIGVGSVALAASIGISVWIEQIVSGVHRSDLPVPSAFAGTGVAQGSPVTPSRKPELSIHAIRSGWIEVYGFDGTVFRNRTMLAGEVYYPRMNAGWTITVRDAGAFEWQFGEQGLGRLGSNGEAAYAVRVDDVIARGLQALSRDTSDTGREY